MQKIEYIRKNGISYPVGSNIPAAIHHTTLMAENFNTIMEFKGRKLKVFCRGSSGAILAALFLAALNWDCEATIEHVKKPGENSHNSNDFDIEENDVAIIIDDIIASGETVRNILPHLQGHTLDCMLMCCMHSERYIQEKINCLPSWLICPQ